MKRKIKPYKYNQTIFIHDKQKKYYLKTKLQQNIFF